MIYLDNSATTKPYDEVIQSFMKVATTYYGNPSSLHQFGVQAENLVTRSREQVADLFRVLPAEIIFTSGGTEGNNLAIKGVAMQYRNRGQHIITTAIEHDSVHEPFKQLEQIGFTVTYLPVSQEGFVKVADVEQAITDETILVSIMHVNNEIGTIQPVAEIGQLLQKHPKILYHVDHVQGIGKVPLSLKQSYIDLCTISGHKIHGLKGTGVLYCRQGVELYPLLSGGAQELQRRSGTENVAGIVSFAKALRLTVENASKNTHKMNEMKKELIERLQGHERIMINTPSHLSAPHIINFTAKGIKGEVFVHALEEQGVFVSTTSACSSKRKKPSKTLLAIGKSYEQADQSIRLSLSSFNEHHEITPAVHAIFTAMNQLKEIMR
ncbi:cysteine desulfurase [Priestia megaterium]|nr:cysteine desulfurase [Priestia megaterium]